MPPQADVPADTSSASKWAHVDDVEDEDNIQESPAPIISAAEVVPPGAGASKVQVCEPFLCYATTHAVLLKGIGKTKSHLLVL